MVFGTPLGQPLQTWWEWMQTIARLAPVLCGVTPPEEHYLPGSQVAGAFVCGPPQFRSFFRGTLSLLA